uniref:FAD/NAD(P)-binding domain-containing protein n=1 Tax=Fagus sylvatica TaxID=28930 RepID=A0A2N9IHU2_FAGSY
MDLTNPMLILFFFILSTISSTPAVDDLQTLKTKVCIIGSGLAAHTVAIYVSRAELKPILFEGWMANGVAPGGQLTTTSEVENFPGFPDGINGIELMDRCRKQSLRFGTQILIETVNKVDFSMTPFKVFTDSKAVIAEFCHCGNWCRFQAIGLLGLWQGPMRVLEPRHIGLCCVRWCCPHFQEQALGNHWRWGFGHGGGYILNQVCNHGVHHS